MNSNMVRGAAAALALACGLSFAAPAFANQAEDRAAAIAACRAEVAQQLGVDAGDVRFDQSTTRGARIDVRLLVRGTDVDGRYACQYNRGTDSVEGVAAGVQVDAGDVLISAAAAAAN
jgi:hypothetical protein